MYSDNKKLKKHINQKGYVMPIKYFLFCESKEDNTANNNKRR